MANLSFSCGSHFWHQSVQRYLALGIEPEAFAEDKAKSLEAIPKGLPGSPEASDRKMALGRSVGFKTTRRSEMAFMLTAKGSFGNGFGSGFLWGWR